MKFGRAPAVMSLQFQDIVKLTRLLRKRFINNLKSKGRGGSFLLYKALSSQINCSQPRGDLRRLRDVEKYYAIFYQLNNEWGVRFPDVDSIHTSGKDMEEAFDMATDALSAILVYGRKEPRYKEPSSFESVLRPG